MVVNLKRRGLQESWVSESRFLGELGLVGGGPVSSGVSWWALGDAGAWLGV